MVACGIRIPRWLALATVLVSGSLGATVFTVDNFDNPPNDSDYEAAMVESCSEAPTSLDPQCAQPYGQWNLRSMGGGTTIPHATGIAADAAWDITVGRPDVVVTILDSGLNYDHRDLRNKVWLNRGELPVPQDASGDAPCATAPVNAPYDCNADGVFSVQDYLDDARVTTRDNDLGMGDAGISVIDLRRAFAAPNPDALADFAGIDNDGNGFIDDLTGYDADDRDGDEYPATRNGHGTGRAGFIAAQTNNGFGVAGICPNCRLAEVRVDDTFVHKPEGVGIGAIWAADHGHEVINMALGATASSSFVRAAFDYASRHNVLSINATANEFSYHQNFHTIYDDVMGIGAVVYDTPDQIGVEVPSTYLRKANFSNYGAHIDVVAPTDSPTTSRSTQSTGDSGGTSSAVPHAAGAAAMVISRARELIEDGTLDTTGLALPDISAQEVRHVLRNTADDIVRADDPGSADQYPTITEGWDKYTGYGRINVASAVEQVANGIPPEADINSPDWYSYVDGTVSVGMYANARWQTSFNWVLEVGAGIQPGSFTMVAQGDSVPADPQLDSTRLVDNLEAEWDTTALAEGAATLRLRVTDDQGNVSEDRMTVWIRPDDPQDLNDAWPRVVSRSVGERSYPQSLESISVPLVDLDGDNDLEMIFSSADGEIHALHHDGTSMPGFPVRTDPIVGLPSGDNDFDCDPNAPSPAFDCDLGNGEVPITGAATIFGASVGDIDRDGVQEVCTGSYDGNLYCWNANDGSRQFKAAGDPFQTLDEYDDFEIPHSKPEPIPGPGVFGDLDGDGDLEIVSGGFDQQLYAWHHDGSRFANFPIALTDSSLSQRDRSEIISMPTVADIDADGQLEIVVATTETYGDPAPDAAIPGSGSGRAYALAPDDSGSWAVMPGWPVAPTSLQPCPVPLVACGVGHGTPAADVDGDGDLEIAMGAFLGGPFLFGHEGGEALATFTPESSGVNNPDVDEETPEGGPPSGEPSMAYVALGAFANVDGLPGLEYLNGTLGTAIGTLAAGSGPLAPFDHHFSVWTTQSADSGNLPHIPQFPRIMEDWQFFTGPAVADIDPGSIPGQPEMIVSSGGYFVHAFNAAGLQPDGWPKRTGQWTVSTPSVGDLDGDGDLEVVSMSRLGTINVWDMGGATCDSGGEALWRKVAHDEWNSGALGTDTRRPNAVSDLTVERDADGQLRLTFTSVGDDGPCATASSYIAKRHGSPIDRSNVDDATDVEGEPAPQAAGNVESFVAGDDASANYALIVADEVDNRSPIATPVGGLDEVEVLAAETVAGTTGEPLGSGRFRLANSGAFDRELESLELTVSNPGVLESVTLLVEGEEIAHQDDPGVTVLFALDPALVIPAGGAVEIDVEATLLGTQAQAKSAMVFALAGNGALLLAFATTASARRRRRWTLAAAAALFTLAACSNDSGTRISDPGNLAPTPSNDSAAVPFNAPPTSLDVLSNDSDPDGDNVRLVSFPPQSTEGGSLQRDDNGSPDDLTDDRLRYQPPVDFSGIDTFTYVVDDGRGATAQAAVSVTVGEQAPGNQAPTPENDSFNVTAGAEDVSLDVLANDTDPDGDVVALNNAPSTSDAGGSLARNDNGTSADRSDDTLAYTPPDGFTGTDGFTYTVADPNGATANAAVTLTVAAEPSANNPPTPGVDSFAVNAGSTGNRLDVLANDTDPDGDSVELVSFPATSSAGGALSRDDNGTANDAADDVLLYTPAAGFSGTDDFTYTVRDPAGATARSSVNLTVTDVTPERSSSQSLTGLGVSNTATEHGVIYGGLPAELGSVVADSP